METTVRFAPELGDLYTSVLLFGGVFIALVVGAVVAGRRTGGDARRRVLLPMLLYFGSLLALMGALGTLWTLMKFPVVEITASRFIVDGTSYPPPRGQNIRFEDSPAAGSLGGGGRVLLVQTKDRRTWAFPGERYDVQGMYRRMRQ